MPAGPDPMTAARRPVFGCGSNGSGGSTPVVEHRLDDLVPGVAVAVADGDRLVDLVAPAVLLARRRADPAEHARERDRPLEDPGRLAPVALGVLLEEARDVDMARALVLAGRQAVGVVVAEDQLEVGGPQAAELLGLGLDLHPGSQRARAADRRVLLALDLDDAHPAGAEAGQLRLVAQGRDLDPVVAADLEDRLALAALDDASVDLDPDDRRRLAGAAAPEASSSRSASVSAAAGRRAARSGRTIRSVIRRLGRPRSGHRDRVADAGRAGAAEEVVVELGTEVSHRAGHREGRQPLVVAQAGTRRCRRPGRRPSPASVGRGVPTAIRSAISDRRRVPIRHGIVLPQAWSAQNRVSSRARSTTQARSSATTIEPEPTCAPTSRSDS